MKQTIFLTIAFIILVSTSSSAQVSIGGDFVLEQSVIATGGGESIGAGFSVYGTAGQSIAGTRSTSAASSLHGGFWNGAPLAPTAAHVEIGGRVTEADGRPITNATILLTEADGSSHRARTNPFGWYRFSGIVVGQTVLISVEAKRYTFAEPTRALNVVDNFNDLNFVAVETW